MNRTLFSQTKVFILALAFAIAGFSLNGNELMTQGDLSGVVKSTGVSPKNSALLIVRLEDGTEWVSGGSRTETTYPPASTAKIPHTLYLQLRNPTSKQVSAYGSWPPIIKNLRC